MKKPSLDSARDGFFVCYDKEKIGQTYIDKHMFIWYNLIYDKLGSNKAKNQ